jgi:hypothetical protein
MARSFLSRQRGTTRSRRKSRATRVASAEPTSRAPIVVDRPIRFAAAVPPSSHDRRPIKRPVADMGSKVSEETVDLRGIFPVVYTPFDADGRVDE